jgi:hypothetical protein
MCIANITENGYTFWIASIRTDDRHVLTLSIIGEHLLKSHRNKL